MRSFGFGISPALSWSFVLLSVARLVSCAPIAGRIDVLGFEDQLHPHILPNNAPKTPLMVPIPTQITSLPAATPAASSRRSTYVPPATTGVIDTSEPTRPLEFNFPGFLIKSTQAHPPHSNAHSGNIISVNNDPNTRASNFRTGFPFNYLSRIPPPRSAPIMFPSSSSSTGTSSSSQSLDATLIPTTDGGPAVVNEPSESSQLPLNSWQMNVGTDALVDSDPPPATIPIAKVFDAAMDVVSENVGMINLTLLGKLKCLVRHGSEKTKGAYFFVFFHDSSLMMSLNDTNRCGRVWISRSAYQ